MNYTQGLSTLRGGQALLPGESGEGAWRQRAGSRHGQNLLDIDGILRAMRSARTKVVQIKGKSGFREDTVSPPCWGPACVSGRSLFPASSCSKHVNSKDRGPAGTPPLPHHPNHLPPASFQILFSGTCRAHKPPAIHHGLKDVGTGRPAQVAGGQLPPHQPPDQAPQAEVRGSRLSGLEGRRHSPIRTPTEVFPKCLPTKTLLGFVCEIDDP